MASFSELIQYEKPLWTDACANYAYDKQLLNMYRFTSRFGEEVRLAKLNEDGTIALPRSLCPLADDDRRVEGEPIEIFNAPTPRPNQIEIFNQVAEHLQAGKSGIVSAFTGWGKSPMSFYAIAAIKRKTLIITTKEDIFDQWVEGAQKFLGLDHQDVGIIRGNKCEVIGTKIVVAMIQSLSRTDKYPDWITKDFGLVIFDEIHRVGASQFSRVADMFPAKLRLGLSATPQRSDGKELLIYAHIGQVFARTENEEQIPKVLIYCSHWQCPRYLRTNRETGKRDLTRIPHEAGRTIRVEKAIATDEERNHLLSQIIKNALDKERKLIVFSTLHEHLKRLYQHCHDQLGISAQDMGFYIGATSKADKERRGKEIYKPILFTTYAMMGEGTSFDWFDSCLLAMPRANVAQPVGRIRRTYENKKPPITIDIIDEDSPVFLGYARSRLKWYEKIGAQIKQISIER